MRKELKQQMRKDEFASGLQSSWAWVRTHGELLRIAGPMVLVLVVVVASISMYRTGRNRDAAEALRQALITFNKPLPGGADVAAAAEPAFASAAEKYAAARDAFEGVVEDFGGSEAAREAAYYVALCQLELGEHDAAIKAFNAIGARREPGELLPVQARLSLAAALAQRGDVDASVETYDQLLGDAGLELPRDYVLLRLARTLEDAGRHDQASRAYLRLTREFPESLYTGEARQRARYLDPSTGG